MKGFNFELSVVPDKNINLDAGVTLQKSSYEEPQEFNEKRFFRAPDSYGFVTFSYTGDKHFGFSASIDYTGKMLIPYFGMQADDPDIGELRTSRAFFDAGIKLSYKMKLNGASIRFYGGVKNIFNSFQDDFDYGIDRDPGYIYGPLLPRTIYFGLKVGNFIGI